MGKSVKKQHSKTSSSKKSKSKKKTEEDGIRGIVRIAGKDASGYLTVPWALKRVRGIGINLAKVLSFRIHEKFGIAPNTKVGELSDEQIEEIDKFLFNLDDSEIPSFMLNRQKDPVDGKTHHVIMNDLVFSLREDIEREKKLFTWRGFRHMYGQKVRGQRTKNTGRRGTALGVVRKSQRK